MKAYSNDLRRKIVSAYERGHRSQREVAELFGVSPATVRNFVRRAASAARLTCCPAAAALARCSTRRLTTSCGS
jgi:transposase